MSEPYDSEDLRWDDIGHIAEAVSQHLKNKAYLLTGGSDGCAACMDLTTAERAAKGGVHIECAENGVAFKAAQRLARDASDFDLRIAIARALDDPRLFQWVRA